MLLECSLAIVHGSYIITEGFVFHYVGMQCNNSKLTEHMTDVLFFRPQIKTAMMIHISQKG